MVREKYLENDIFPRSGKSQGICGGPEKFRKDLESQGKVREFVKKMAMAGSLRKINSVQEGKGLPYLLRYSLSPIPPHWGLLLKKEFSPLGS